MSFRRSSGIFGLHVIGQSEVDPAPFPLTTRQNVTNAPTEEGVARVPCPSCKELVHAEATICPFCRQPIFAKTQGKNAALQMFWFIVTFFILWFGIRWWSERQAASMMEKAQQDVERMMGR